MTTTRRYALATIPALLVLGFFVWFANWIPQTRWDPPRRQAIRAEMTPLELVQFGETIARQRGCMACHTIEPGVGAQGGGRGPNWANIATRRAQGVPGGQSSLIEYLTEALYDPGAYLVDGYADIMPAAIKAPSKLGYEEVVAVVNYLQSLGGTPSVRIGDIPRPQGESADSARPSVAQVAAGAPVAPVDAAALFTSAGCAACHSLSPGEVLIGPALEAASLQQAAAERGVATAAYVTEAIVDPGAFVGRDFPAGLMPQDFGTQLSSAELEALVAFLLSPAAVPAPVPAAPVPTAALTPPAAPAPAFAPPVPPVAEAPDPVSIGPFIAIAVFAGIATAIVLATFVFLIARPPGRRAEDRR